MQLDKPNFTGALPGISESNTAKLKAFVDQLVIPDNKTFRIDLFPYAFSGQRNSMTGSEDLSTIKNQINKWLSQAGKPYKATVYTQLTLIDPVSRTETWPEIVVEGKRVPLTQALKEKVTTLLKSLGVFHRPI